MIGEPRIGSIALAERVLVTDNDLDSMGDESSLIYEGQTVKFCCPPCEKKFLKNPARYLAKLAPPEKANAPQ